MPLPQPVVQVEQPTPPVYIKIRAKNVQQRKGVPIPIASGRKLDSSHLVVTVHEMIEESPPQGKCSIVSQSGRFNTGNNLAVLQQIGISPNTLQQSCWKWEETSYAFHI